MKQRLHELGHVVLASSLAATGVSSQSEVVTYDPISPNPDYAEVSELSYRPHDQEYAYGDDSEQFGMLWLPDSSEELSRPLVVFVHGGCWLKAYDIAHSFALATALSQAGYPVWNLEYRRSDDTTSSWPASFEDLQRGILALQEAVPSKLWSNGLVIMGHSAGGHLALLLAAEAERLVPTNTPFVAAVGLAAITDISLYAQGDNSCQRAARTFIGAAPDAAPQDYLDANPTNREIGVPVILLHGEKDAIVPREQWRSLQTGSITRVLEPGAGHFDWVHPGTPAFQTVLKTLGRLGGDST